MRTPDNFPFDPPQSPAEEAVDLAERLSAMQEQLNLLAAQVAELSRNKQMASDPASSPTRVAVARNELRSRAAQVANDLLADTLSAVGVVAATALRMVGTLVDGATGVIRCYTRHR